MNWLTKLEEPLLMGHCANWSPGHTVPIWRSRFLRHENHRERHGRLMKSWQHRTGILEVCSVGKRSEMIGKPVRQSFIVKLCRGGRHCGYDLFMDRFQSCAESETSLDCRISSVRAFVDSVWAYGWSWRSDQYNHRKLSNWRDFTISYISRYTYISVYICL